MKKESAVAHNACLFVLCTVDRFLGIGVLAMTRSRVNATFLSTLFLLFFIQLVTVWMESIYRMSLTKLRPGHELYGSFFIFMPIVLYLANGRWERVILWVAAVVCLAARALCPLLGAEAQIAVAGLGVGAFLVVLCFALSNAYRFLRGDIGLAVGAAVLSSVVLRSWRSSIDVSMEGATSILGWALVLCALFLFWRVMTGDEGPGQSSSLPLGRRIATSISLFANLAFVYLVLSSPAVVNAWCGGGASLYRGVVAITLAAFAIALIFLGPRVWCPARNLMLGWNVGFVVALVAGIIMLAPNLPATPVSGPIYADGSGLYAGVLLCLMLLLSPVIIFNARHAAQMLESERPSGAILPVIAGMVFLYVVTVLLICTNTWGYMPTGQLLRDRFYVPFLLAGIGILIPFLRDGEAQSPEQPGCAPIRLFRGMVGGLALLGFVGVFWCTRPVSGPVSSRPQLTIMTYNMQQGSHDNGDRNYAKQLALLREVNADIIGLQECDPARPSGGNVDAVRYFADSLGYFSYYGPNTVSGTFGTAILSRYPIRNPRTFFTYSSVDEIGTAAAEVTVGETPILFLSNHPAGPPDCKDAHVDGVLAEIAGHEYVISVGDYNFRPHQPYFARLAEVLDSSAFSLGEDKVNYHGGVPNIAREIDHIFVSRSFRVLESHYLHPPDSQTDHPAHWAVVEMVGH